MPVSARFGPPVSREAQPGAPAGAPGGASRLTGWVVFHPRYERFLRRCGIDSTAAALALRGEVVCGHPDRHVARVELAGRAVFLKREHLVGLRVRLRNRLAGFGWVSRSEREAVTLRRLEEAGLPGPQWLAYGDDGAGRAFLLVDELGGMSDLRAALADNALSPAERRDLAERAGRAVAELHEAGFGTPELAAKHLFVEPRALAVTLIDWQSAPPPGRVADADRVRQLAGLHASLADGLATPKERLRFAWAYRRTVGRQASGGARPRFGAFVRAVAGAAGSVKGRSSTRDQRAGSAPRLVWLAGEAVCAVPEVAAVWPEPAICPPFYPEASDPAPTAEEWITLPGGRRALLHRFRTRAPLGRLMAAVRERPWRSPAAVAARVLFHLRRYGIPAPALLAFGQRRTSAVSAESFVLYEPLADAIPVSDLLSGRQSDHAARVATLRACGALLRDLHDAALRPVGGEPLFVATGTGRVAVVSPFAVRLAKHIRATARRTDLRLLLSGELAGLSRADRCRVVHGYLGAGPDPAERRSLLRQVLRVS